MKDKDSSDDEDDAAAPDTKSADPKRVASSSLVA